jgi:hypothetical protein
MMIPFARFSARRMMASLALTVLVSQTSGLWMLPAAAVEPAFQSRLSRLLIHQSNAYLPTRLVIGEETRFVVKAQPGSKVKILVSSKSEGYVTPEGTALRVGDDAQELTGVVPENGVLELKMDLPKDPNLEGKVVYVEALSGPTDDNLTPITLVDATGRRTDSNSLTIVKPPEKGGAPVLPSMPGMSPQMFNQLTQLGDIYTKGDGARKQLLDNGDINHDRDLDQNPFTQRGFQPGLGTGGSR